MIRSVLASPWLPLFYWAAAVVAMVCTAGHEASTLGLGRQEFQIAMTAAASAHVDLCSLLTPPPKLASAIVRSPTRFWDPEIFVFQREYLPVHRRPATEVATNKSSVSTEAQAQATATITMFSIRLDPPEPAMAKMLAIQCRTSAPISNAQGRTVTIHGIVTKEVVSSAGRILIMAGSRVVGSGRLDPENGRFKSDGLWSVFFDDTELKVEAELLDRPSGLPGILGEEVSSEDLAQPREVVMREGRSILVPRNSPFVLELHGEILLRDLKGNEASN
jgi:hypothetical protein